MPGKVITSYAVSGAIHMRDMCDALSVVPGWIAPGWIAPGWIARSRDGAARTGAGPARSRIGRTGR